MFRKTGIVWLGLVFFIALGIPVMAQDAACDEAQVRTNIQRVIDEGFNQGNTAVVDELFAEDYIAHPDDLDREGFKTQVQSLRTALPNSSAHIDHLLVEGCDAFFVFHQSGLMEGELAFPGQDPILATGRDLHFDLHVYLRLNEQGQLVEEWDYFDNLPFLTQLGIIPSPEGTEPMAEATDEPVMEEPITTGGNEVRNTEAVLRAYEEGFNTGDFEMVRGLYSPDYADQEGGGIEDVIASLTALRGAMPDATITVNDSVAQGDFVATRLTLAGTFQNELAFPDSQAIPATGEPLTLEYSFLHRLTPEGLVVEDWNVTDQLSFLEQTGLMETAPDATAEAGTEATAEAGGAETPAPETTPAA
jgi:predicted ester cyclase